jgi:hypothetical protein
VHNIITQKDSSPRIAKDSWRHKTQNINYFFIVSTKHCISITSKIARSLILHEKFGKKFSSWHKLVNMWPTSSTKRCFTFLQKQIIGYQLHSHTNPSLNFFNKLPWQDNYTPSTLTFHTLAKSQNFNRK